MRRCMLHHVLDLWHKTFAQAKFHLIPVAHSACEPIFSRLQPSLGEPLPPREEAERRNCHARQHRPAPLQGPLPGLSRLHAPLPGLSRLHARQPALDTRHRRNQEPRATVQRPQTWPRMWQMAPRAAHRGRRGRPSPAIIDHNQCGATSGLLHSGKWRLGGVRHADR